ncbi:MAG: response regulator transcription factor [Actinomycetota bacterium]
MDLIRVLLADEQALFREAVRVVLEAEDDICVVAEVRDGLQAVTEAERTQPDVALLDAGLPNRDGVRATAMLKERVPNAQVIVVAADHDLDLLVAALEAGASGFITKASPLADLLDATRTVHGGESLVPRTMLGGLLQRLLRHRREQDDALRRLGRLTRREREVLALLADGADNDRMAQTLVVSPQTARTHIQNVLGKLEVHSRLEAAMFVTQNGIQGDLVPVES